MAGRNPHSIGLGSHALTAMATAVATTAVATENERQADNRAILELSPRD